MIAWAQTLPAMEVDGAQLVQPNDDIHLQLL